MVPISGLAGGVLCGVMAWQVAGEERGRLA